ncbi:hydroxypyruvate isomerase [Streptomyces jeddahensis]|uniref:Hydroxypyruvate isomerase n=1 Tax=Streptomyces jeddahensis TaxID=1716141 RepID=A0A177HNG1_9ACTN|nr:hydroxypyruvate isomerase [Streptomyces jeddahensis]
MTPGQPADGYALNLSLALARVPEQERLAVAREAGFRRVEMWWPFASPEASADEVSRLRAALQRSGTRLVCLNIDAGDFAAGDRGILSDAGQVARCRQSIDTAVDFASEVGCTLLNLPYGNRRAHQTEAAQHEAAYRNLLYASQRARASGVSVLVEPLNTEDNPGYLLPDVAAASVVVGRARKEGADNVGILLDLYHVARSRQDPCDVIARYGKQILHVQFADVPGRGCPGTGMLDFPAIIHSLVEAGYGGCVGLEFQLTRGLEELSDACRFAGAHPLPRPSA